jgi:hypothetical protein
MKTISQALPFTPPVEGCEIERIDRVGPFITHVLLRLPNGQPWTWSSRQHRFLGGVRSVPAGAEVDEGVVRWWLKVGLFARVTWWISALFVVGASCFAAASAAGLVPRFFGAFADSAFAMNLVFFIGSIFFTTAAYFQLLAAVNADRISALAHRQPPEGRFRWFAWRPRAIGWLSAFTQFIGTVLFNVNTFDALLPTLDWLQEDLLIWTPDALGSICFLVASALALVEYGGGRLTWQPRDVSWWVVNINMLGSIAFGVSAIYAFILPGTAELLDAWAVNVWTLLGAICFLVGAFLLLPELGRNLRRVVAGVPSD